MTRLLSCLLDVFSQALRNLLTQPLHSLTAARQFTKHQLTNQELHRPDTVSPLKKGTISSRKKTNIHSGIQTDWHWAVVKCIMLKLLQSEARKWDSLRVGRVKELVIKEVARVGDCCPESWRIEFRCLSMRCKEKGRVLFQPEPGNLSIFIYLSIYLFSVLNCLHNISSKTVSCVIITY